MALSEKTIGRPELSKTNRERKGTTLLLRSARFVEEAAPKPSMRVFDQQPEPMDVDHQQTGNDCSQDITMASGGGYQIVDSNNSLEALQGLKMCVDDVWKATGENDDRSAPQGNAGSFESDMHDVRASNEERGGEMFLLSYDDQNKERRCDETNMMETLTGDAIQALRERGQSSSETSESLENPSQRRFTEQRSTKSTPRATAPPKRDKHRDSEAESTVSVTSERARGSEKRLRDGNADYSIIAKNILAIWQGSTCGVMGGTHCIIRGRNGKHEYTTWAEIQQRESRGSVSFPDVDYGKGLHAKVDRDFLEELRGDDKLTAADYNVDDAVMYESKDQTAFRTTVFVTLKNKDKLRVLKDRREAADWDYEGPIRSSRTGFIAAGGKEEDLAPILNRRQPEMYRRYLGRGKSRRSRGRSSARDANGIWQVQETLEKLCGAVKHLTNTTEH
ncbi:hypothetical protein PMIN04_007916 [Paraphaeosphaeria minitans]|uniref:Uncharacterized protein n=1 Tax=Paraphaeosphaeria minitans TaxID=565426 RepID=A0A9P6G777_9PLEO|nr:hypothetical protein PMIN01_12072 [Paraphaeosphaeria minitans]